MPDSKKYYAETLRFLMGSARKEGQCLGWRFDMIGLPEDEQADSDEGLSLLEVRPDGIYVKSMADDNKHRSVEISFITGDTQGRRKSGLPLLPIPFTVEELRRVQGGALGIVEGIFCGAETEEALAKLGFLDPEAEEVARALGIANLPEPAQAPDPQRRLAALRALGGDVKWRRGKWSVTHIVKLENKERDESRPRASQKTIRADLLEAAEAEAKAAREGAKSTAWNT
jgi:hypothetical protein